MHIGKTPYGLKEHIENTGSGLNLYRGEDFGQPRTLQQGDKLSNEWVIASEPYEMHNGDVRLYFSNGKQRIVPARIPLQLKSDRPGIYPAHLRVGNILQTGCVVLEMTHIVGASEKDGNQDEVLIKVTGGWYGHEIGVPSDLPIAVVDEMYPPSPSSPLGAFALEQVFKMHETARQYLPKLGQLALEI